MAFLILTLGCLSGIVAVGVVIVALYLQNRQANKDTGSPGAPPSPLAPPASSPSISTSAGAGFAGPDLEAQVRGLMASDREIEAIKVYRQATGVGLKEAKAAVEAFEQGQPLVTGAATASQPPPVEALDQQVRSLLQQGLKINAIKVYRQATGAGLAEAKTAVEAIEREMKTGDAGAQ